ncbi:hypothetical protein D3C73_1095920 [compost metagenome]
MVKAVRIKFLMKVLLLRTPIFETTTARINVLNMMDQERSVMVRKQAFIIWSTQITNGNTFQLQAN